MSSSPPTGDAHGAVPPIAGALGGVNDAVAHGNSPPNSPSGRRSSLTSIFSRVERAPSFVSEALEHWQTQDAARGRLHEARLEATFEDDESVEQELEHPEAGGDDLECASTTHSSMRAPNKGAEGPERDPFLVTWESTHSESENPRTWTFWHKMRVLVMYASFSGIGPWASSMASPASEALQKSLHFSKKVENDLVIGIFMLAFVFGPLSSAPISENVGRRKIVLVCNLLFIGFNIGCAVSQTATQMIVLRFFAGLFSSAMIPMGGGCISDMFEPDQRGIAMALYSVVPLFGPCVGPVVAGWILQGWGEDKWRWIFWTWTMVAGAVELVGLICTRETYAPVLLRKKAAKLRKETQESQYHSMFEKVTETPLQKVERIVLRPMIFLTTELSVMLPSLYMAIIYGCFYLLIASLPRVYRGIYEQPVGVSSLHNLALGVGLILFGQVEGICIDLIFKKMCAKHGGSRPEYKLPMLMTTVFITPCALILFGWTAYYRQPWIAPDIGLVLMGIAVVGTILQVQMYMADLMGIYAASAISATLALRSLFAFVFCLISDPLFDRLGINWGVSLLALISAVFGIPSPFLLYRYGPALRRRSKYCVKD